jgi:hypothetical protein
VACQSEFLEHASEKTAGKEQTLNSLLPPGTLPLKTADLILSVF